MGALLEAETVESIMADEDKISSLESQILKAKGVAPNVIESMSFHEADPHARVTLVMRKLEGILKGINDKDLSIEGKERKEAALHSIKKIDGIKILDPRVLLKIYDMNKYKQPTLKDFI